MLEPGTPESVSQVGLSLSLHLSLSPLSPSPLSLFPLFLCLSLPHTSLCSHSLSASLSLTPLSFPPLSLPLSFSVITYSWSFFPVASCESHAGQEGVSTVIEQLC